MKNPFPFGVQYSIQFTFFSCTKICVADAHTYKYIFCTACTFFAVLLVSFREIPRFVNHANILKHSALKYEKIFGIRFLIRIRSFLFVNLCKTLLFFFKMLTHYLGFILGVRGRLVTKNVWR